MSEKKPRQRGVLAGLLGMTNGKEAEEAPGEEEKSSPPAAGQSTGQLVPPPTQEIGGEPAAGPQEREAYEPGWYRISLQSQDEGTTELPEASETHPETPARTPEPAWGEVREPSEVSVEPAVDPQEWEDPQAEAAPVPAGMRESYEPGWYRISLSDPNVPAEAATVVPEPEEAPVEQPMEVKERPKRLSVTRRRRGGSRTDRFKKEEPRPAETPAEKAGSALESPSAKDRRAALRKLSEDTLSPEDVRQVGTLVQDPERDIRAMALDVLARNPEAVDFEVIRRALQDPTDEVRASAVRLAAAHRPPDFLELLPLAAARRWPVTQQTTLEVLPALIERESLDEQALDSLLFAVASMESSPVGPERDGLAAVALAVGRERLVLATALPDDRRLGAVRLLLEEGSPAALAAISERAQDPLDEVRIAATAAKDLLAASEPAPVVPEPEPQAELEPAPGPEPEPEPEELPTPPRRRGRGKRSSAPDVAPAADAAVQAEIITGLARALEDPDEAVRTRARDALGEVDRSALVGWARRALAAGDQTEASLAARVAEAVSLHEVAAEILDRASGLAPESRGAYVGALSSVQMDVGALVALAAAVDVSRRPDAIRLLWQVGGRKALPALRNLLDDSSGQVRVAVLEIFGDSGDPSAIEVANRVLARDSSPVVRATAIQVIGRAGMDQRTASLAQALEDPDPDVRSTAVELLPQGMGEGVGELLLKALSDDDERVWQPAMRHLVSLPNGDVQVLWSAIRQTEGERREQMILVLEEMSPDRLGLVALDHFASPDVDDRMLAVSLAARAGTRDAIRGITQTLQDPVPAIRRAAAAALAQLGSPEAIPALSQALADPDSEVRVEALRTLSVIDDERVVDSLISALKDPESKVREVGSEALIRWTSPAVARRLVESLRSPVLRKPVSELLARMGTSAVEPLVNILVDGYPELAPTVGDTLEQLVGRDVFIERLGSMDPDVRLGAVLALGAMGGREAIEGLSQALSDPNEQIRIRAVRLLGELGDPAGMEAVRRTAQGDPVPDVVAAAEEALHRLQNT